MNSKLKDLDNSSAKGMVGCSLLFLGFASVIIGIVLFSLDYATEDGAVIIGVLFIFAVAVLVGISRARLFYRLWHTPEELKITSNGQLLRINSIKVIESHIEVEQIRLFRFMYLPLVKLELDVKGEGKKIFYYDFRKNEGQMEQLNQLLNSSGSS